VSVPTAASRGTHHFEAAGQSPKGGPFQLVVAVKVVRAGSARATAEQTLIMVGVALLVPLAAWLLLSGSDRMRSRSRRNQPEPQTP
jgi:hypothetical protein